MKPLVVFPDAQAAGVRLLRTHLAGRAEPYAADVTVGARVPRDRSDDTLHLPYVMVRLDDDRTRYPVTSRAVLRITVWHLTPEDALDLAQLCRGLLHAVGHGHGIRAIESSSSGPMVGIDPDTAVDLATFTVAAQLRPVPVG